MEVDTQPRSKKTGKPIHTTPKKKKENPISSAISSWLQTIHLLSSIISHENDQDTIIKQLLEKAPKRWVVYEPMVLLPSGSFTSHPWPALLTSTTPAQRTTLWTTILRKISPSLTHLAINEGIPLTLDDSDSDTTPAKRHSQENENENLLRSPSGLHLLHGDFGPALPPTHLPSLSDFNSAFWVTTKQNGIVQTWAPRYTMFSRGNVKEKARLLEFPHHDTAKPAAASLQKKKSNTARADSSGDTSKWAVDLYAGIGYFVFSYAKMGFRLLCWELNPWSVEGLRRGAVANGWDVVVVETGEGEGVDEDGRLVDLVAECGGGGGGEKEKLPQIVVFLESNEFAEGRVRRLREALMRRGEGGDGEAKGLGLDVVHVNCGFLPTSSKIWEDAWRIMVPRKRQLQDSGGGDVNGWLHLHENVGVKDIEKREEEIQGLFDHWSKGGDTDREDEARAVAKVQHVEMVKTFAPDVWHVVFDLYVSSGQHL